MRTTIQWSQEHNLFYFQHGGTCRMLNMIQLWNLGVTEGHIKKAFEYEGQVNIGAYSLAHPNRVPA